MEVEIGRGKKGRRAYGFDDIAIVPSRRTRETMSATVAWTAARLASVGRASTLARP